MERKSGLNYPTSSAVETIRSKELVVRAVNFDVITISGESGTLKTSVARRLQDVLGGHRKIAMFSRGEELRAHIRGKKGEEIVGPVLPEDREDEVLDVCTKLNLHHARQSGQPVIVEGRLAGVIGKNEEESMGSIGEDVRVFSVLIISENKAKQHHRVHKRQSSLDSNLNLEDTISLTEARQEDDLRVWHSLYHGFLGGKSPFDPDIKTKSGNDVYDSAIGIDNLEDSLSLSSEITLNAVVNEIVLQLAASGFIEIEEKSQNMQSTV